MPCTRHRKTSDRTLPYPSSKPKAEKPTTKKPKAKSPPAPTPEQRKIIDALYQSEFVAREGPLSPSALGDLSNDILPIFDAANFPKVKNYRVIEPSVRLASHLLKHPSLRHMFRTILKHGRFIPLKEKDSQKKPLYAYPNNTRKMTDADIQLIDKSFEELADFVTFRSNEDHTPANASTVPLTEKVKPDHRSKTLRGHRSRIEYSRELLKTLTQASKPSARKQDRPLLLAWRFIFAVQLAHEVCHALVCAKDGHKSELDTEPFFPKATTAEVGFTMEETLFGGSPSLLWAEEKPTTAGAVKVYYKRKDESSDLVGISVVWPWPCTSIVRDYQAKDCGLWMRKADMDALVPKDVAWRVPLDELSKFFETEFWAQKNPPTRLGRTVGFAFSCDEKGNRTADEVTKRELRSFAPRGYTVSQHKALVKTKSLRGKSARVV